MDRRAVMQQCYQEAFDVNPGLAFLYTGKLSVAADEDFILDVAGTPIEGSTPSCSSKDRSFSPSSPICVEADLVVEDFDGDDDLLLQRVPSAFAGRRLMEARAQQCVVCFAEKEHTFVPPHQPCCGHVHQVTSHRFCTDCWVEFLRHGLQSKTAQQQQHWLVCPVCRVDISVPDNWIVRLGLPVARQRRVPRAVAPHSSAAGAQVLRQSRALRASSVLAASGSLAMSPTTRCMHDQDLTPAAFWAHPPSPNRNSSGSESDSRFCMEAQYTNSESSAEVENVPETVPDLADGADHGATFSSRQDSSAPRSLLGCFPSVACGVLAFTFFVAGLMRNVAVRSCLD